MSLERCACTCCVRCNRTAMRSRTSVFTDRVWVGYRARLVPALCIQAHRQCWQAPPATAVTGKRGKSACSNAAHGIPRLNCASGRRRSIWFSNHERYNSSAQIRSAAGRRVRMGANSQKPDLSVTKTTPVRPVKRCGDWVLRVFQRKPITPSATTEGSGPAICTAVVCAPVPNGDELPSYFQLHLSAGDYSGLGTHPLHAQLAVLNVLDCSLPS